MSLLRYIWYIALKDLKLFVTDRGALFFFILFPLLFITMFALLGGESQDPRLELHLVTLEAEGGLSHQILGAMETTDESELEPGSPIIVWDRDYTRARQMVEDKEIDGFLVFPADFTEGLMTGFGTQLEIVADIEAIETRTALYGLAGAISSRVGSEYIVAGATIELLIKQGFIAPDDTDEIERIVQQLFQDQDGVTTGESFIEIESEKVGEIEAENPANWSLTGYLVMFVFFGAALSAESIVRERQNNTLERLLTGSVSRGGILGGIFTGTAVKGLIQILIFWLVGILIFKADVGLSPAAVIVLSVLMVIVSSAFGVMLATLVRTQRSAGSIGVLASLVLAPLGGCWWPLFLMPKWLQALARISPHGWANTAFNKLMLFSADFGDVVPEMLVLVGFAVIFGFIAVWRFRTSAA
jgi:ABC-2 type transport system permease protein